MKRLRRVTEAEVIAEFLRNEFYTDEFQHDRDRYQRLVLDGDLTSERENAVRRALLFRRRGHMWRELPADLQWWEAELEPHDVLKLRVLSRSHWRSIAGGSYRLGDIAERVRAGVFPARVRGYVEKIQSLSQQLRRERDGSAVMLIGVDEHKPLVILEGNHRMTAAMLAGPELLTQQFRVLCGLSPRMVESCWYRSTLPNLMRYLKNRLLHLRDREADVSRILAGDGAGPAPQTQTAAASERNLPWRQL